MANIRTEEEIIFQVEGLNRMKGMFPEFSKHGNRNNWAVIDAQIAVLQGLKEAEDYYIEETLQGFCDGDNDAYYEAVRAEDWLFGITNENIFTN